MSPVMVLGIRKVVLGIRKAVLDIFSARGKCPGLVL